MGRTPEGGGADRPRHVRLVGSILLGAQLVALVLLSALEYHRYALSVGFGTYAQAWTAIGSGHLDPFSTFIGAPFWQNDAEFILWPLGLLHPVYPHAIDLLVVQDLALVGTEAVAFVWVLEILWAHREARPPKAATALAWASLVVILADPFAYETAAYDFHTEVLAALFVVLAARALWHGTFGQLWLWVPLALASLALASMYVVALGVSALLAGRRSRRAGGALVVAGGAYLVVLGTVDAHGFGQAHSLAGLYGYLVGPHHGVVRPVDVVGGVLRHPWTAMWTILRRWYFLFDFFVVFGLVGLWSVWTWPLVVAVMLPSALSAQVGFLNPLFSFQSWPTLMLVLVGTVLVLQRMLADGTKGRLEARVSSVVWAIGVTVVSAALLPTVPGHWLPVRADSAAALARLDAVIPRGAQVIVSSGFVGRFGVRPQAYAYAPLSLRFPVTRPAVYFVIVPGQGNFEVAPSVAYAAVRFVDRTLGGRTVVAADGVYGLAWTPPAGTSAVRLPGPGPGPGAVPAP